MSFSTALPGGALAAITGTAVAVDLAVLAGYEVEIWCDDQDILFCPSDAASTSTTLVTAAPQAASLTVLVAYGAAKGVPAPFVVAVPNTRLVVATATGSGTLRVKPIRRA